MKILYVCTGISLALLAEGAGAGGKALDHFKTLALLDGDWILSPAGQQEGGATEKGPAEKLVSTGTTAMRIKLIGKGSTLQENLLPGSAKEMATMYHCNNFRNCSRVLARHYCAKQNRLGLVLDADSSNESMIVMNCDMDNDLCNSVEGHVHRITHELSQDNNHLRTTYTIFKDGKPEKHSIYHFDRWK